MAKPLNLKLAFSLSASLCESMSLRSAIPATLLHVHTIVIVFLVDQDLYRINTHLTS